jgi:hypothetical protein
VVVQKRSDSERRRCGISGFREIAMPALRASRFF